MGIIKNNFWSITAVYSVGFLSLRAISFLLLPLYTNLLSTLEAGYVFILYTIIAFLNTLYNHGMDSSLLKYFKDNNDSKIITTSTIYSSIWGVLLSILIYLFSKPLIYFNEVTHYSHQQIALFLIGILFCDMLSSRLMTVIRLLEKPIYFLVVSFANVLLSIYLNVWFIYNLNMGFGGALIALFYVSIVQLLLLAPLLVTKIKIKLFDFKLLRLMVRFSLPFLPASIFFIMIEMADRIMLGWLSSVDDVGLYGAGYKIGALILLIVKAFNLNWQPFYLKPENQNDIRAFEIIGTKFIILLIFFSTLLSMLWSFLFQFQINDNYIIGNEFWMGGNIIPIIALSYIIYGLFILQMPSIYIREKQSWVPYFWGMGCIINILSNYILIPIYGFYGAALSTLFAYISMTLFLIYKNSMWMQIKYNLKDIGYISIISALALYCYFSSIGNIVFIGLIYLFASLFKIINIFNKT